MRTDLFPNDDVDTTVVVDNPAAYVTSPALNYYRLARLTLIAGTEVVCRCVLKHLPAGQSLHSLLEKNRRRMKDLYELRIINDKQWRLLYPDENNADLRRFDLTLWMVLLRNVVRLGVRNVNWNDAPKADETEWYHDVLRIRETRNTLSHLLKPELDDGHFEKLWNYVVAALRRLDGTINVEQYRNSPLDKEALRAIQQQVNEQVLQETNAILRQELGRRRRFLYCVVIGFVVIIVVIMAAVVALFFNFRAVQPCSNWRKNLVIDPVGLFYILEKTAWSRRQPRTSGFVYRDKPLNMVYYTHTDETGITSDIEDGCSRCRNMQDLHMDRRNFSDIAFHYIINGAGTIYYGRPLNVAPDSVKGHYPDAISVAIMGNYQYDQPKIESVIAFNGILEYVFRTGWLTANYKIYALCDLQDTDSPGRFMYELINDCICSNRTSCSSSRYRLDNICKHLDHKNHSFCTFDLTMKNKIAVDDAERKEEIHNRGVNPLHRNSLSNSNPADL